MTIATIQDLALDLKTNARTLSAIKALDPTSMLCQQPANAVQMLKVAGYPLTVTTGAAGEATYKISA